VRPSFDPAFDVATCACAAILNASVQLKGADDGRIVVVNPSGREEWLRLAV
jgi:hypothetical protein